MPSGAVVEDLLSQYDLMPTLLDWAGVDGAGAAFAFARKPQTINLPPRRQGESICYGPDGKTLYLAGYFYSNPWRLSVLHGVAKVDFAAGRDAAVEPGACYGAHAGRHRRVTAAHGTGSAATRRDAAPVERAAR